MYNEIKNKIIKFLSDKKFSEILTGSFWALAARVIATVFGMVTSIIIARVYGADVLGIVAILTSFLTLATIFTVLGTSTSILRLIPEHLTKYSPTSAFKVYRKTQFFVTGVSFITGTILFFGSDIIAHSIFAKPHLQFYFAIAAIFIVFKSLMLLNTSAVRGLRLIRAFAFMQMLPQLSMFLIIVSVTSFYIHRDNPIYAMMGSFVVTALAGTWIMNWAFKKKVDQSDVFHFMPIKDIIILSLPMLLTATIAFVIGQIGVIILGIFRTDTEVGYYYIAVKLSSLVVFLITAINSMAASKFSELYYSDNKEDLYYIAKKAAKLIFWTVTPILVILVILGKKIIILLYGTDFAIAYLPMCFLALGQFITSITGSTGTFMNMTGLHGALLYMNMITMIINVMLSVILIPTYGIYGASIAAMIGMFILNISSLIFIKIKHGKIIGYMPIPRKLIRLLYNKNK